MRSRRSSRDSRPSSTADDGDDSENSPAEGTKECLSVTTQKSREKKKDTLSPAPFEETKWTPSPPHSTDFPLAVPPAVSPDSTLTKETMEDVRNYRRPRLRSSWACAWLTFAVTLLSALGLWSIVRSFQERQCDIKGCKMTTGYPTYLHLKEFDTEHTRFASKYGLYLYREGYIDTAYPVGVQLYLSYSNCDFGFWCIGLLRCLPCCECRSKS